MNWKIEVKPTAEKYYRRLDRNTRHRIYRALKELEEMEDPFHHPNVRQLIGKLAGDYRLRVGKWRVLFTPDNERRILYVYAIISRGDAY